MKKYLTNNNELLSQIDVLDELPLWSAAFGLKLLEYVAYKPHITALDIGFGTGFPLTELAMRLGNSSLVYGIDPWKEAIVRAHKKTDIFGVTNVKIIEGFAESIPLEDNSTDLITSNNGINNVEDIDKVFAECARILKKGGQFVQTMNTDKSMIEFYEHLEQVLKDFQMFGEIELMYQHIAQKRPSVDDIISKLKQNGFEIIDLENDQFNYRFADGTAMLNHFFIRLAFIDSWIGLLPVNRCEQIFDLVEQRLNEQAKLTGGIKLSIPFVLINAIKE